MSVEAEAILRCVYGAIEVVGNDKLADLYWTRQSRLHRRPVALPHLNFFFCCCTWLENVFVCLIVVPEAKGTFPFLTKFCVPSSQGAFLQVSSGFFDGLEILEQQRRELARGLFMCTQNAACGVTRVLQLTHRVLLALVEWRGELHGSAVLKCWSVLTTSTCSFYKGQDCGAWSKAIAHVGCALQVLHEPAGIENTGVVMAMLLFFPRREDWE